MPTIFAIEVTPFGDDGSAYRWNLYMQGELKPFMSSKFAYRRPSDAFENAEKFLARQGKKSLRRPYPPLKIGTVKKSAPPRCDPGRGNCSLTSFCLPSRPKVPRSL